MRYLILRSGRHGRVSKDGPREPVFQQPSCAVSALMPAPHDVSGEGFIRLSG